MLDGKDQFERWIEEGVRHYVGAEPPLGLEARVLAEVQQRQRQRSWWQSWTIALPAAAVLVIAIGLSVQQKTRPQSVVRQVSTAGPPAPVQPVPPSQIVSRVARPSRPAAVRVSASAPRPETFPATSQPSEQEMALARLARNSAALRTVAANAARGPENIEISRVQIDPVEISLLPGGNPGE